MASSSFLSCDNSKFDGSLVGKNLCSSAVLKHTNDYTKREAEGVHTPILDEVEFSRPGTPVSLVLGRLERATISFQRSRNRIAGALSVGHAFLAYRTTSIQVSDNWGCLAG